MHPEPALDTAAVLVPPQPAVDLARPAGPVLPVSPDSPASPARRLGLARDLVALVRPSQWFKNLLVVPLALLDAPRWTVQQLWLAGWAVLVFTVAAGLVYIVNDVADRRRDRSHPTKWQRPIAAGRVSVPVALVYAAFLAMGLGGLLSLVPPPLAWPVLAYLAVNVVYSGWLKHVALVDIFVISAGFLLRMAQGYVATGVRVSDWLLICVFAFCLLLCLGKRRHEILYASEVQRPALRGYTVALTDQLIVLNAGLTGVAFLLYLRTEAPIAPHGPTATLVSAPFALFTLFRYLQTLLIRQSGGDPVRAILGDPVLVAGCVAWALLLGTIFVAARYPDLLSSLVGWAV